MKRSLIALTAAAALVLSAFAATTSANAQGHAEKQWLRALGVGAAIGIGAAAFGAAARAHMDPRYHSWAPEQGYYYYPAYSAPPPAPCPNGFWSARIRGYDNWGNPVYGKPRWTCPPQGYSYSNYYYRRY